MGRPPLPPEERAVRRITLRLYAEDQDLLTKLCDELGADESEVMRMALRLLAARRRKRATS